ncbi:MAG TPA: response regulator [Dehalococcoidia bacterium]|nr:response regulator [Dehalococcoidia bacterium]
MNDVTVLLVDEHDDVRGLLSRGLGAYPPLKVVAATRSPMKGIQLAETLAPDIILVDLRRRGQYSAETYSRIGRASPTSRLVVYTSYLTPEEERAACAAGACCCMLKGLSIKELAARLVQICTSPASDPAASGLGLRSA